MRLTLLLVAAAGLSLTAGACSSSSSSTVTTDAGKPKSDAGGTKDSGKDTGATTKDAATDSEASGPCAGIKGKCVPLLVTESETDIDTKIQMATSGETLAFGPGTFSFANTIAIVSVPNLTIIGAGIDKTILDFSKQTAGADGIDVQDSNNITLFGFTVQDSAQNAIKVLASKDVIFEAVKTSWTNPDQTSNGPYGIYPVSVTNVLVENCVTTGASDSGMYIGQSQNAVVRNNEVYGNVAGIEIENTWGAVVDGNNSHDNTAGILVFDLPNLPQQGGHDVRVINNKVTTNNTANFATNGDIVSKVPTGTGILVMANHDVEVTANTVTGSGTFGIAVVSYYATLIPITDATYYPYPYNVYVHDNTLSGTGTAIDLSTEIGLLLESEVQTFPGMRGPDLAYDGAFDPKMVADAGVSADGGPNGNPMNICFQNNGASSTFIDINVQKLVIYGSGDGGTPAPDGGGPTNLPLIDSFNIAPFTCARAATASIDAGVLFNDAAL